jgi:hypothetical protein
VYLDPKLAKRYGLTLGDSAIRTESPSNHRRDKRAASEIFLYAAEGCPRRLVSYWPDFEKADAVVKRQWPTASVDDYFAHLFNRLPPSNLAELARRCLTNITAKP